MEDEAQIVRHLGLDYVYIPVDFAAPSEADYAAFCQAMTRHTAERLHVHCIYNARVSAFMLRYARDFGGDVAADAALMDSIWRPGGAWAAFLGDDGRSDQPHAYAGEDYDS